MVINIRIKKIKIDKQSIAQKIAYFILASPSLFLLINRYPYYLVISILLTVLLGVIFYMCKGQITSFHRPLLILLVIIYLYFILSYFFSGQYLSNFLTYRFLRTDGNFFFCYILFFVFAVPFFDYKKVLKYYFKFLFFIFSIFSIYGVFEWLTEKNSLMVWESPGAGKIFHAMNFAHNATGSVYALVSIFALIFFLEEKVIKIKFIYLLPLILSIVGLFMSKSRGSYLAFIAALIFVFWFHFRSIKKMLIAIVIFLITSIPFLWLTEAYKRFLQIFQMGYTTSVRLDLWERALFLFSQSPIFGIGFGRYNDIHPFPNENLSGIEGIFALYLKPFFSYDFSHAHNAYFQFLAETGIIGLGLLMLFWILCFKYIFQAFNNAKDDFSKKSYLGGIASIVILFILSLTENYFSATTIMVPTSMILALCIGLYWQESNLSKAD